MKEVVEQIVLQAIKEGTVAGIVSFDEQVLEESEFIKLMESEETTPEDIIASQFSELVEESQEKNEKQSEQIEESEINEDIIDRLIKEVIAEE